MNVTLTLTEEQFDSLVEAVYERLVERSAVARADGPEYLSVKDAAAYLGCTEGRIRKLIERRQLPCSQDGPRCRVFVSRTDLDLLMQGNRNERRP